MSAKEDLINAIKQTCQGAWESDHRPVLLSAIPRLIEKFEEMKEALDGKSLKKFIYDTSAEGGYELIEHPTQRAKVGVAPAGSLYRFPLEGASFEHAPTQSTQAVTLAFLSALAELPEKELDGFNIPVRLLVRLLK